MKKRKFKILLIMAFFLLLIYTIYNSYKGIITGNQDIVIKTSDKAYINDKLYVSVIAKEYNDDLDTKYSIKLLDSNNKEVENTKISYQDDIAVIDIPEVESGNYFLETKVSTKKGKDIVKKEIYISDFNQENIIITLDKGIYKPGDIVNYRALIIEKNTDKPVDVNVNVSIYDGNDNKVYNENIKTSDYGIISGSFQLVNELNSGIYKIIISTDSTEVTKQFKVNPYITPKYEVNIDTDKGNYLVGDTAKINISAKYFFGEPVQNAEFIIYIDGQKYKEEIADFNGNLSIDYPIEEAKSYSLKVEAKDSSNYYVENTSSFTAGTDLFEIELLPEYGSLIDGMKNEVYIFTSTADGQPVKTYVTISSNEFTKQVATDENGIGSFSIDVSSFYGNQNFNIKAENMKGEIVNKKIDLNINDKYRYIKH